MSYRTPGPRQHLGQRPNPNLCSFHPTHLSIPSTTMKRGTISERRSFLAEKNRRRRLASFLGEPASSWAENTTRDAYDTDLQELLSWVMQHTIVVDKRMCGGQQPFGESKRIASWKLSRVRHKRVIGGLKKRLCSNALVAFPYGEKGMRRGLPRQLVRKESESIFVKYLSVDVEDPRAIQASESLRGGSESFQKLGQKHLQRPT